MLRFKCFKKGNNRDSQKDSLRENQKLFFTKKNCVSLALLLTKIGIYIYKKMKSDN